MKNIDLTSPAWCEFVFERRNKNYGAYLLRRESSDRHLAALLIMLTMGIAITLGVNLYNKLVPKATTEETVDTQGPLIMTQFEQKEKTVVQPVEAAEPPKAIRKTVKLTPPVVRPDDLIQGKDEFISQDKLNLDKTAAIGTTTYDAGTTDGTGVFPEDVPIIEKEPEIIDVAEQMPEYPGGSRELMSFLSSNIKYPAAALEQNIQGSVLVRFVVSADGTVSNIEIVRSLDPSCDKEAVRVLKSMPKWIPGKQNGVPVNVYFTLPIRFKLAG